MKLDKKYLEKILDSIEWPNELKSEINIVDKYKIALIIQQNLLMSRMFDLLSIAVGLSDEEVNENNKYTAYPSDSAYPAHLQNIQNNGDYKELKHESMICGVCGKGVVPNRMGYCPKCNNDLRKQRAQEATIKKE